MKNLIFVLLILAVSIFTYSCKKDLLTEESNIEEGLTVGLVSLSVEEAKNWYFNQLKYSNSSKSIGFRTSGDDHVNAANVIPIWSEAQNTLLHGIYDIVVVPFLEPDNFPFGNGKGAKLIFLKDENNQIHRTILVYEADPTYLSSVTYPDVSSYTGITYQVNEIGYVGNFLKFNAGQFIDCGCLIEGGVSERSGPKCYDFSPSWWDQLIGGLTDLFTGFIDWLLGGANGNSGNGGDGSNWPSIIILPGQNVNLGSGSGPSGGFSSQINNSLFEQVEMPECREDISDLGDDFPAFPIVQEFGNNWLNAFMHAYLFYKNDPTVQSFSAGILKVQQQIGLAQDRAHFLGNQPKSSTAAALYPVFINIYTALLNDYDNAGGQNETRQCDDFHYSLGDVIEDFEETLLEELSSYIEDNDLNITATEFQTFLGTDCFDATDYEECLFTSYLNYDIARRVAENPNYLDEIIRVSTPPNPLIDKNHPICPEMFQPFTVMDPINCPDRQSIGISNLNIGLNISGSPQYYTLSNLHIEVGIRSDCPISMAQGVANAINQAILSAEIAIEEGNLALIGNTEENEIGTILREINRHLTLQFKDCRINRNTRHCNLGATWPAEAEIVNDGGKSLKEAEFNTIYIPFESEFEQRCH